MGSGRHLLPGTKVHCGHRQASASGHIVGSGRQVSFPPAHLSETLKLSRVSWVFFFS